MTAPVMPVAPIADFGTAFANPISQAVPDGNGFAQWLDRAVGSVDRDVAASNQAVQNLALGQADSLHGVMLALENARESVALMVQVRNRLVEAYQDLLRMQI